MISARTCASTSLVLFVLFGSAAPARAGFLHVATSATIVDHSTYLDGATNQYQLLIVTPLLSPADESSYTRRWFTGVYNDHPIGVWFDATVSKWAIFNQDFAPMTNLAAFWVDNYSAAANPTRFLHTATPDSFRVRSTYGNSTYINHPGANGRPDALLFVTANWNPNGGAGVYNPRHTGVWYDDRVNRWAVFNEDNSPVPVNAAFNVVISYPSSGGFLAYRHRATTMNTFGYVTYLGIHMHGPRDVDELRLTPTWQPAWHPERVGGIVNNHAIAFWYDIERHEWAIVNEDLAPIPLGVTFNINMSLP